MIYCSDDSSRLLIVTRVNTEKHGTGHAGHMVNTALQMTSLLLIRQLLHTCHNASCGCGRCAHTLILESFLILLCKAESHRIYQPP